MAGMSFRGFYDGLEKVSLFTFSAAVLSMLLLFFKQLRPWIAITIMYLSLLWSFYLWLNAILYVAQWSIWLATIGILLAGVGVFPIALVMALVHHDFRDFFFYFVALCLLIVSRYAAGRYLETNSDHHPLVCRIS
jgi:hypothetical protein